jgi:hypothetical protein
LAHIFAVEVPPQRRIGEARPDGDPDRGPVDSHQFFGRVVVAAAKARQQVRQ